MSRTGTAVAVTVTPGTLAVACNVFHWAGATHTQVGKLVYCHAVDNVDGGDICTIGAPGVNWFCASTANCCGVTGTGGGWPAGAKTLTVG
jgi:hypothetical protein